MKNEQHFQNFQAGFLDKLYKLYTKELEDSQAREYFQELKKYSAHFADAAQYINTHHKGKTIPSIPVCRRLISDMLSGETKSFHHGDICCSCGDHFGFGVFPNHSKISAADRAARYKRMRERLPSFFTAEMEAYLTSYERAHGSVEYQMRRVGSGGGGEEILAPTAV